MSVQVMWSYPCGDRKGDGLPLPRPVPQLHMPSSDGLTDQTPKVNNPKVSPVSAINDPGFSADEWDRMLKLVHWAGPDRQITTANMSTSPNHSAFFINDLKGSYYVGEEIHVTIVAKDFTKTPKSYGGDLFQAKVYSDKLKASVFGEVLDHQNGTYSARFTLPWVGLASVAVRLIHSSEAVQALGRHRSTDSKRVFFHGYYVGNDPQGVRVEEKVECSIKWEGVVLSSKKDCCCEYQDAHVGLTWQCLKPQILPCSARVYHSMGGYRFNMTALEKVLFDRQHVNRWLKGDSRLIRVMASNTTIGVRESCKPGLPTPIPSGFYMNDVWTSFVCAARNFAKDDMTQCLKDKHIYMMGDSTTRQWFEYLILAVPTLKPMNLHSVYHVGPHMAVDVQNNIDLHFRSHGLPLRCVKAPVVSLHYMSNEIDGLAGGSHTVVVLNMWAHFTNYPLSYFAYRVSLVRRAVVELLRRAPETKVIIKSANTGIKDIFSSDWFSLQLDRILREGFRGVGVYILDVWQMTSCHYNSDYIHPAPVIIKNEIDILLSFICPK
ncbi:NXPE family member 3-like [Clupea harengus]|uniref:NXPE family member 3-like n=1 Tax=Clupea harengus TaxID=7950 RepID=A0A8M1KSA5_CLUHA|nr:NXPE family member 3-like [Clupea harengus]